MSWHRLWPDNHQCRKTIAWEANALEHAAFLAVHQPMQFLVSAHGQTDTQNRGGEEALLEALLEENPPNGFVLLPVIGESGSGKSHAIRWLHATLSSRSDRDSRALILIEKNTSLKTVLRTILRDLTGDRYDQLRSQLEGAAESVPEQVAADLKTRIVLRLRNEPQTTEATPAASLLSAGELWDHFYCTTIRDDAALPALARIERNISAEGTVITEGNHQFRESDFRFSGSVVQRLGTENQNFAVLCIDNQEYRQRLADVCNGVLDAAIGELIELGGASLEEIFLGIRAALLEDEKDLVILVEDFAALSGIQGGLLQSLIKENTVGGQRKYCVIRSAVAYTPGVEENSLMVRDTVRTRAPVSWTIEDSPGSEAEILGRSVSLVAAYWNAARWGIDALRERSEQGQDLREAFQHPDLLEDSARAVIEAFGSSAGYPLFPLNREAIENLVKETSRDSNGRLSYRPRAIIQRLVFEISRLRSQCEQKTFPPPDFGPGKTAEPEIVEAINRIGDREVRERLNRLVWYYAAAPQTSPQAAAIDSRIFETFALPRLDFGTAHTDPIKPDSVKPDPVKPDRLAQWSTDINDWITSGQLASQTEANNIRGWLVAAIFDALPKDWPGLPRSAPPGGPRPLDQIIRTSTFLPGARGNPTGDPSDAAIVLSTPDQWSDPQASLIDRQGLEAVIRFHDPSLPTSGHWQYEGGEKYAAHYSRFVRSRTSRLALWVTSKFQSELKMSLDDVVATRLAAVSILGHRVDADSLPSMLEALFLPDDQLPSPESNQLPEDHWNRLREQATDSAKTMREVLSLLCTSRQGAGQGLYAADMAALIEPSRQFFKDWKVPKGDLQRKLKAGHEERRKQVKEWKEKATTLFGNDFDHVGWIAEMRLLLQDATRNNLGAPVQRQRADRLIESFGQQRLTEKLSEADKATGEDVEARESWPALAGPFAEIMNHTSDVEALLPDLFDTFEDAVDDALRRTDDATIQRGLEEVSNLLENLTGGIAGLGEEQ